MYVNIKSLEQPRKGRGRIPITESFQDAMGQSSGESRLGFFFPQKIGLDDLLRSFQPGLSCGRKGEDCREREDKERVQRGKGGDCCLGKWGK